MLPKPLPFRDMGYIKFEIFLIAFTGIFCQQVNIQCILLIAIFHYDMWAFKVSLTVLLRPTCSWCEFSSSCCAYSLWTFLVQGIITKFTHPFNPIRPGGRGLRGPDDQTHGFQLESSHSLMPKLCDFQLLALRHVLTKF